MNISVLGAGRWGTALAVLLAKMKHRVTLHSVSGNRAVEIQKNGENKRLPGVALPENLALCDGFERLTGAELCMFTTSSYAIRETAKAAAPYIGKMAVLTSASKGIESGSMLRMSQILEEEIGCGERIAVLSGPAHAEEIVIGLPTGLIAASSCLETARLVQDCFMSDSLRVYTSSDVTGVELCAALKNVIAISVGISDGLGYGDNTKAMLMTRGLSEITALGEVLGGRRETFSGLAGVGDLIVTCTSRYSRNHQAGVYIGEGMSTQQAMEKVGSTVEGYYAARAVMELSSKTGVETPITDALYSVLYENRDPREATTTLMNRTRRDEY